MISKRNFRWRRYTVNEVQEVTAVEIIHTDPQPVAEPPRVFSVSELETQVAVAKRYPRDVTRALLELRVLASESRGIARRMYYSLKRGENKIEGASIRFAETLVYCWENLRVYGRVIEVGESELVAEGYAWDIQRNAAIAKQVRRRIVDKKGQRYNADMVTVTGNAAISLAIRNAVLSIVPSSLWGPAYEAALSAALGEGKDMKQLRDEWIAWWEEQGRTKMELWEYLAISGPRELKANELRHLLGLKTAIDEGLTVLDYEINRSTTAGSAERAEELTRALREHAATST